MHEDDIKALLGTDYARIVGVVTAVCGDPERAEDAVQDAIVDVWRRSADVCTSWVAPGPAERRRAALPA